MMQIPPIPPPVLPAATTQDLVAKAATNIQAQAAVPVTQRAVDPSPKSSRGQQTRSNGDRAKGGDKGGSDGNRGNGSVNMQV